MNFDALIKPNKNFARSARIKNICEYYDLYEEAQEDFENFWKNKKTIDK